jgi:RNA polymerase sigma factor for flagellar operon FliA
MPRVQARDNYEETNIALSGARDAAARNALMAEYAPLVKFLANRIAMRLPPNVSLDDLISAGSLGLLDAIEKFDPRREVQLKTYAECRIKGAILDELRSMDWMPRSIRKRIREMEQATAEVEQKLRRPAGDSEIAGEMGIDLDTYYDMFDAAQDLEVLSLDAYVDGPKDHRGSERSHKALIRGDDDPVDHVMTQELKEVIAHGIKSLSEKEQLVVSLYYYDGLTLKEIGAVIGLTESRISQIHTKAAAKLRSRLRSYFET